MSLKYEVIGRNIRDARKQKNMTKEQAAEFLDVSLQHYGKLERGDRHINLPRLAELSEILEVPLEKLVEGAVVPEGGALMELPNISGNDEFLESMRLLSKGCSEPALRLMLRLCASVAEEDKSKNTH